MDFVDLGSLQFTEAYAQKGDGQQFTQQGASIQNVHIDGQGKADCSSNSSSVSCSYVSL